MWVDCSSKKKKNWISLKWNFVSPSYSCLVFWKFKHPPHRRADHFWRTRSHVSCDWTIPEVQRAFPDCLWGVGGHHSVSEWSRWFQFHPESGIPHSLSWQVHSLTDLFYYFCSLKCKNLDPTHFFLYNIKSASVEVLNRPSEVYQERERDHGQHNIQHTFSSLDLTVYLSLALLIWYI